jgi:regulator of protease activity HflC (stomatin/prohibitin superfamily)
MSSCRSSTHCTGRRCDRHHAAPVITRGNVSVGISAVAYFRVVDAEPPAIRRAGAADVVPGSLAGM